MLLPTHSEVNSIGFVCHVDLFPVSPTAGTDARQASRAATTQARSSHTERTQATGPSSYMHPYREWAPMQLGFPAVLPAVLLSASLNPESARGLVRPSAQAPYSAGPLASTISYIGPGMDARGNPDPDVVAHSGDRLVRESLKCTASLVGSKVAAAVCVEYQEKNAFMFVFADISVKVEGTYLLRYRAFDIFAQAHGTNGHPVLAECYGGTFKVYSTKDFPGLHASTDLTKHLSCRNVRVASRENERERKRRRTVQTSYVPIAPAIQRSDRRSTWSPCSNWNVGNRHGVSTKL